MSNKKTLYKLLSEFLWKLFIFLMGLGLVIVGIYGMEKDGIAAWFLIGVGMIILVGAVMPRYT